MTIMKSRFADLLVGFAIGAVVLGIYAVTAGHAFGSPINSNGPAVFFSVATSTAESVAATNTRILATSTGRTWARIANISANPITCIYGNGIPATVTHGFIIAASSTFSMNQLNEPVYTGAINCISDTAAAASIYVEANQ